MTAAVNHIPEIEKTVDNQNTINGSNVVLTEVVSITILNRTYNITCKQGESSHLINEAQAINDKIAELRIKAPGFNNEQLAILTALDIYHELCNLNLKFTKFSDIVELRMKEISSQVKERLNS